MSEDPPGGRAPDAAASGAAQPESDSADTDATEEVADTDVIELVIGRDDASDDDLFDRQLEQPKRKSRLTWVLLGAVLVVSGFTVGATVERNREATQNTPILTGTVQSISGNVVQVADSSAAVVAVTVSDSATVSTFGLGGLAIGAPVEVTGARSWDGSIAASTVTTRRTLR